MPLKLMSAVSLSSGSSQGRQENLDKLLKQLLECIQQSQKRYGGKNELATEFDSCVAGLCLCLEAVFLHGVRAKPQISQVNSTLKQVSDIVVQSLHIGQDSTSFWPFIQRHLTNHEKERYVLLKHIWTDIGKCRAWIRATLNEKSLERYFHTLLGDKYILAEHYESWALLRDEDKNSMLPNMAAGLGSILFAMSIDKPEFNSSIIPRTNSISFCVEPIIKAPIPENIDRKKDQKKKRRVARQFISFDDDMLSTSVPSVSSSSTCSDASNSGNLKDSVFETMDRHQDESVSKEKHHRNEKRDQSNNTISESIPSASQNDATKPKMTRKLSIENSGSREKFTTTVPESLTPINHNNIGELTPVSVERIKDFEESPDISDDILEVPTDISAVLTAVENKNQEELRKREEKINLLTKENENLKEQVKKYVEAIQMLRRDDEPLQKALDGLQIEKPPDYKVEAKIYEQKLVQVAEMHAELMDFNVALQQSLCKKDTLLEKLKKELEELKGPISIEFSSDENTGNVNVWIPSAFLTGSGSNSHHVYQVYLRAGNDEWNIYRRYAQFHALHTDLKKLDPIVGTFDFPPKKSIGKKDSSLVEDRRKRLQVYLRRIIGHWPELAHCASRFLLEQHLAFFKDQRDEEAKKNMFNSRRNTGANHSGL